MPNMKQLNGTQSKDFRHGGQREVNVWLPVGGNCPMENLTYKAIVITENQTKFYVGSTGLSFKNCFTKHRYIFKNERIWQWRALSKYTWKLQNKKINSKIQMESLTNERKTNRVKKMGVNYAMRRKSKF